MVGSGCCIVEEEKRPTGESVTQELFMACCDQTDIMVSRLLLFTDGVQRGEQMTIREEEMSEQKVTN